MTAYETALMVAAIRAADAAGAFERGGEISFPAGGEYDGAIRVSRGDGGDAWFEVIATPINGVQVSVNDAVPELRAALALLDALEVASSPMPDAGDAP